MADEDFLSRWSRRKRDVAAQQDEPAEPEQELPEAEEREPETDEEEAALLARLELPRPESLKAGDDFSVFMARGVPEFLRRRALRVLWRSNPVLANLDGLNDYDDDYTSPELTKKVLATAYKVGRGFVSQIVEDRGSASEETAVQASPDAIAGSIEMAEVAAPPAEIQLLSSDRDGDKAGELRYRPRRMRFDT